MSLVIHYLIFGFTVIILLRHTSFLCVIAASSSVGTLRSSIYDVIALNFLTIPLLSPIFSVLPLNFLCRGGGGGNEFPLEKIEWIRAMKVSAM